MAANITFGAWLKRRRQQLDLTQKGLAFQAGCSVGTIRKIEADERRPSRQLATLLAQQLDILPELKRGLDILEAELRDVPQRQRSVRATFGYSWRKLSKREQSIFAQLSIFRSGFTRLAVQAVTGATPRQLSRLVNKSFIQFNKRCDRYQVHELLRQYGADRLGRDSTLEMGLYDRHCTYYCHALGQHTNDLKGARQRQALATIEADFENVRLAWNHAVTRQDLATVGTSLEALYRF